MGRAGGRWGSSVRHTRSMRASWRRGGEGSRAGDKVGDEEEAEEEESIALMSRWGGVRVREAE